MNDGRVTVSKYAWVAAIVVFVVVFGYVLVASSPRDGVRDSSEVAKPEIPAYADYDRTYAARVPAEPQVSVTPAAPPVADQKPALKPRPAKITPRDMFPVGNITRNMPAPAHPYRQIAELYPSFGYHGKVWLATGRYVHSSEVDLVPTGLRLATGQYLFSLTNGASDGVLFVRSGLNADKFAVYRAT